jgi:hypothetical protein
MQRRQLTEAPEGAHVGEELLDVLAVQALGDLVDGVADNVVTAANGCCAR